MHPLSCTAHFRRRLRWLLWFALCLPVAQYAASRHALSHAVEEGRASGDLRHSAHAGLPCETCALAAAVTGAAPGVTPHPLFLADARHAAPRIDCPVTPQASVVTVYQSRAPPVAIG